MATNNIRFLALALLLPAIQLCAQQDDADLKHSMDKFYSVLSFSDTNALKLDSLPGLFTKNGKLVAAFGTELTTWTATEFVGFLRKSISTQGITSRSEREVHSKTEWFGNIAHVFSTYELTVQAKGQTVTRRGINSIQLVKQNGKWNIISLTWDRESGSVRLPGKYLRD